jgi:hypothetical protein
MIEEFNWFYRAFNNEYNWSSISVVMVSLFSSIR